MTSVLARLSERSLFSFVLYASCAFVVGCHPGSDNGPSDGGSDVSSASDGATSLACSQLTPPPMAGQDCPRVGMTCDLNPACDPAGVSHYYLECMVLGSYETRIAWSTQKGPCTQGSLSGDSSCSTAFPTRTDGCPRCPSGGYACATLGQRCTYLETCPAGASVTVCQLTGGHQLWQGVEGGTCPADASN